MKLKRCPRCDKSKSLDDFHFSKSTKDKRQGFCKECRSYNEKNITVAKDYKKSYREKNRDYFIEYGRKYSEKNREKLLKKNADYRNGLKEEIFKIYGSECSCCGEKEKSFLCIDHVNGGGTKHRRKIGSGGTGIYLWLRKNNYPKDFRILCHNCNWSSWRNKGICIHKQKRDAKV